MIKTKYSQSNPSASPHQSKRNQRGKKAVVSTVRQKKIPQQEYRKDSAQKAQTERYEQMKYEIAGESGKPGKHKDGGGLRKRMKEIRRSRKTSTKTQESS